MPNAHKDEVREQEYIDAGGVTCIHCNSTNMEAHTFKSVTDVSVGQDVQCLECKTTWTDIYYL